MSTPRPAMFVAIVTAPCWPASLMISASRACSFAFRTLCWTPWRVSSCERYSDVSTAIVPTSTGWPFSLRSLMSRATAANLPSFVLKTRSCSSLRATATFVGISTTFEVVDLDELLLLRLRRAGHAAELLVEAEVVLQRDRRERLVLFLDPDALLRLDRLVQALAPAAAFHDAAGELVDDLHLAVLDHVLDVAVVERLRLQRLDRGG